MDEPMTSAIALEEAPVNALVKQPELTLADRCDRCGAQAFVRALLLAGDLLFCAHHGREYNEKLAEQAILVDDQSERINKKPSPGAY